VNRSAAGSLDRHPSSVVIRACPKDEPAFSYIGTVGPVTAFAGGWSLTQPACVRVSVRVRGHRFVYARTVSFGMGRAAGNCDKI